MAKYGLSEKEYRIALQAAVVIEADGEALDAMAGLAQHFLDRDMTQEAANLLVFIMNHPDVLHYTFDFVDEWYQALEESASPHIIEDAKAFRLGKTISAVS